jgi:hypothetical protein
MKKNNIIDRIFSLGNILLILLIPPIILFLVGNYHCKMTGCGLVVVAYVILPPILYVIEIIIFSIIKFGLSRFLKTYQLALILSGITLIAMFFLGPELRTSLATLTNNITFCKMMNLEDKRDCISTIAANTLNESLCNDPDVTVVSVGKESCLMGIGYKYSKLAYDSRNSALCEKAGEERMNCYEALAELTKNSTLCEKLPNYSNYRAKDVCFLNLAKITKNAELCNKMEEAFDLMDECLYESRSTK